MTEDRGTSDLERRIEELNNSLSIALETNDKYQRENKESSETIVELRQRINELMSINKTHQDLMGKQIVENEELKRDNKALAKQIDDYFNVRVKAARDNAS